MGGGSDRELGSELLISRDENGPSLQLMSAKAASPDLAHVGGAIGFVFSCLCTGPEVECHWFLHLIRWIKLASTMAPAHILE